jgi:hypothetical protein
MKSATFEEFSPRNAAFESLICGPPGQATQRPLCFRRPGLLVPLKLLVNLWLEDDSCEGAGQFVGANSLTHRDEELVCCSIG